MNAFAARVEEVAPAALRATGIEILQFNVGLRCNMACAHCHQACSPERSEAMSDEVIAATLRLARRLRPALVDITGGAPELHPRIRALVAALAADELTMQLRTNLTALLQPGAEDLPEHWAGCGVDLVASLPSWEPEVCERQRGRGSFAASVAVLRRLNALGYGAGDGLRLELASNPEGTQLPGLTGELEARFRRELRRHGVRFDALRVLANVPLGRFDQRLRREGEQRRYLRALQAAFSAKTLPHLGCRTCLAVAWDGELFDCDFNLGARLPLADGRRTVFDDYDDRLATRRIAFGPHCFACAAGAGSS